MNQEKILDTLKEGNQRFLADKLTHNLQDKNRREALKEGQAPHTIVLSCADSRVVPELIFDTGLGELFVVRVAGNIANTSSLASIEYAVANCGSKAIIVLGHESCGAVSAAIKGGDNGTNLNHLLSHIQPAIDTKDSYQTVIEKNAQLAASELTTKSKIIQEAVSSKKVKIIPAYYALSGKVNFL